MTIYVDGVPKDKEDQFHKFNDMLSRWRFETIAEFVIPYGGTLEIGIGSGKMTPLIYERFFDHDDNDIFCIDPDQEKIEKSKWENQGVVHICDKYEDIDCSVRTIICSHTLEHVDDPWLFLKKCHDDLRDDGVLIVTVPNALSLHKRIGALMGSAKPYSLSETDRFNEHKHLFDQYKLGAFLRGARFEITAVKGLMLKPFPSVMMGDILDEEWFKALWEIGKDPALTDYCSSLLIVARPR